MGLQKLLLVLFVLLLSVSTCYLFSRDTHTRIPIHSTSASKEKELVLLMKKAGELRGFIHKNNFNASVCFLVNMQLASGRKRFIVFDLKQDRILYSGLVAHGSCNTSFLTSARFSNTPQCGCSSIGRYKIGMPYTGRFGKAYKLFGLDSTNSNAFNRNIVLHSYGCVPDEEQYPEPICNSLGCPMVSTNFLTTIARIIDQSTKPILLSIYD